MDVLPVEVVRLELILASRGIPRFSFTGLASQQSEASKVALDRVFSANSIARCKFLHKAMERL